MVRQPRWSDDQLRDIIHGHPDLGIRQLADSCYALRARERHSPELHAAATRYNSRLPEPGPAGKQILKQ